VNIILSGIVGSTAYGLDTPESDVDRAGIFAVDTEELFGLR
jgi:predicted nucleotidyltransferase